MENKMNNAKAEGKLVETATLGVRRLSLEEQTDAPATAPSPGQIESATAKAEESKKTPAPTSNGAAQADTDEVAGPSGSATADPAAKDAPTGDSPVQGRMSLNEARRTMTVTHFRKFQRQHKVNKRKGESTPPAPGGKPTTETAKADTVKATGPPAEPLLNKRNRSEEEPHTFKRKKTGKKTYAEVASAELRVAIVDKSDSTEWRISEEVADQFQTLLEKEFLKAAMDPSPSCIPNYAASGLIKGHILVSCHDAFSKTWLVNATRRITIEGHWIDCVDEEALPQMEVLKVATHLSDQQGVINLLAMQNRHLAVSEWKVIGSFDRKEPPADMGIRQFPKHVLRFAIPRDEARIIEEKGGLFFLLKKIPVIITKKGEVEKDTDDEGDPIQSAAQ